MARPSSPPTALLLVLTATLSGACGPNKQAPPQPPSPTDDGAESMTLRYMPPGQPLEQDLQLTLTHTAVGQYLEAVLQVRAAVDVSAEGNGMRVRWTVKDVADLQLDGTVAEGEVDQARRLLLAQGKGTTRGDVHGTVDVDATDAEPLNTQRIESLAGASPNGTLLMTVLAEQLRLPSLPLGPIELGKPVEVEEESETVLTDPELVLPTTTVHRYELRRIDASGGTRVAEISLDYASVAATELDPEADESAEPDAQVEIRHSGTLMFDLDRGLPVSLELSRNETFRVGEQEAERSLLVRSRYLDPAGAP